jgi:hypothetical protein
MSHNEVDQTVSMELFEFVESKQDADFLRPEEEDFILSLCRRSPGLAGAFLSLDEGLFLLNVLIRYGASLSLLTTLFEEFQIPIQVGTDGFPLHQACGTAATKPGVISFFMQQYPTHVTKQGYRGRNGNLKVQYRKESPIHWFLLRSSNISLQDTKVLLNAASSKYKNNSNAQEQLLRRAFKGGSDLQVLEYIIRNYCPDVKSIGIQSLTWFSLEKVQALSLLMTQLETLQYTIPSSLDNDAFQALIEGFRKASRLQSLHLVFWSSPQGNNFWKARQLEQLCRAWTFMPSLSELTVLGKFEDSDGSFALGMAALLRKNQIQRILIDQTIRLNNPEPIWGALKQNTSLRRLDIPSCVNEPSKRERLLELLQEHNTSLHHVVLDIQLQTEFDYKIHYWTQMNQLGRMKARGSDTVTDNSSFVDLLLQAKQIDQLLQGHPNGALRPTPEQYLYGMLRESPGSWSQ